jgi:hypothetical protein
MARLSMEMDALLRHAEENGLCLWQVFDMKDSTLKIDYSNAWEDCLWEPTQLRKAIIDYPSQARGNREYPTHAYTEEQLTSLLGWRIIDPNDIYSLLQKEIDDCKSAADFFKSIWIDKKLKYCHQE